MDLIKIGKFISERRKLQNLTQSQLAEKLNITDRAISKWETGRSLPDASIMIELCNILEISVNDLLNGEMEDMKNYKEKYDELLVQIVRQKEEADKKLLSLEIVIGVLSVIIILFFSIVAKYFEMDESLRIILVIVGFVIGITGLLFATKIEQTAGYYECKKCGYRYIPKFLSILFSMHINRTRYMKCPHCQKKSWQKKVVGK